MLKLLLATLGLYCAICASAAAETQGDLFNALPPLPAGSEPVASDSAPLPELPAISSMPDLPSDAPTPPADVPLPPVAGIEAAPAPTTEPALPPITNQSDFDFFQQGTQLPPLPPTPLPAPLPEALPLVDDSEGGAAKPEVSSYDGELSKEYKRPLQRRFNYKVQHLSPLLYRKQYSPQNRHLPVAQTRADYTLATFKAAATNNLNGLRAMLEYGGQSLDMRTPNGETLADVAARHGAQTTLRYLMARGVPRG